jgi:hypothetical protein
MGKHKKALFHYYMPKKITRILNFLIVGIILNNCPLTTCTSLVTHMDDPNQTKNTSDFYNCILWVNILVCLLLTLYNTTTYTDHNQSHDNNNNDSPATRKVSDLCAQKIRHLHFYYYVAQKVSKCI